MTSLAPRNGGARSHGLWLELGATMRTLRTSAGMSLRQAELASGRGRGTLSQVETAKARPPRKLVEWYDRAFGGDGLLVAIYAEARGAHGPESGRHVESVQVLPGDALRVEQPLLATGQLVERGGRVTAGWTVVNAGTQNWSGRSLRRIGAPAAPRLLASAPRVAVPDCRPGERVVLRVALDVPALAGTFAAYWQMLNRDGRPCFNPALHPFAVVVTVQP